MFGTTKAYMIIQNITALNATQLDIKWSFSRAAPSVNTIDADTFDAPFEQLAPRLPDVINVSCVTRQTTKSNDPTLDRTSLRVQQHG